MDFINVGLFYPPPPTQKVYTLGRFVRKDTFSLHTLKGMNKPEFRLNFNKKIFIKLLEF